MYKRGFFNTVGTDRTYNAEEIGKYLGFLITDGVYPNPSSNMQVTATGGMGLAIAVGKSWVRSHWLEVLTQEVLTLPQSNMVYPRIDSVVACCDSSQNVRDFYLTVRSGVPSATPVAYTPIVNEEIKEIVLAEVLVSANVTEVTQANITDTRANTSKCGWVTGLIDQVDTEALFIQWQTAYQEYFDSSSADFNSYMDKQEKLFDDWFSQLREQISTSTLLREFSNRVYTTVQNQTTIEIGIPNYVQSLDVLDVYINGLRLAPGLDYTNYSTYIELTRPLDINNPVEFVVFKSVDGEKAETVVKQVEDLQISKADKVTTIATVTAGSWTAQAETFVQTVAVNGVTYDSILIVSVAPNTFGIKLVEKGLNTVVFEATTQPTSDVIANLLNLGV